MKNRIFQEQFEQTAFFDNLEELLGVDLIRFSCARAGMVAGLSHLGFKRMDEILIPQFMCQAVVSAVSRVAFPSMNISGRTKAVMVFHQFGFPQKMEEIEKEAKKKGWIVVNDCANSIFSKIGTKPVIFYGDFTVLSFAKIYPCLLGGAFLSSNAKLFKAVQNYTTPLQKIHEPYVRKAFDVLQKYQRGVLGPTKDSEIASVYGFLPTIVTFPDAAFRFLPVTAQEFEQDNTRRKNLLAIATKYFPKNVPQGSRGEVVPTAVPITLKANLDGISASIKKVLREDVPVLHFDYNRNILKPDYQKALAVNCNGIMTEEKFAKICEFIKKETGARS